jgi:hypothetical protein
MELKLADYGENKEKFKRFLELGKGFGYFGDFIIVTAGHWNIDEDAIFIEANDCQIPDYSQTIKKVKKDEKDPLNRFDGLFDGRTYGGGRFVLIKDQEHEVAEFDMMEDGKRAELGYSWNGYGWTHLGNLHKNPELYEKIK